MATRSMLIDASHPEETRVVVVDGSRVEDYDVEVASRRQLKGNIYLAKVTRVEPSLQAAFVDYGGNRHGFLAFNEIHPDYYQIPVADRERLLAEQSAAESAEHDDDDEEEEDIERRRARPFSSRYYKIQEVIKRRQIMLVQVAKEERGTKGAALTTYLSLAGRYCVLMPNTSRGGGISRKIAGATDRKRLKKILSELEVPEGMAVIVRTAGAGRSKAEIKRDYEYLVRLWSNIRETTLQSSAPTLVYEEASLIKRSIRDLYGREIEEIIVQGEEEYRVAKEFMKLFISSHAKRVKLYENGDRSLFQSFGVEDQLDSMHSPTVQLRSGGYIVINPTEALVAIDVNSGRSTRERNIEETALRTNLEAADEIARQLRLRDLAGLVVVDFIDMENPRNQGMVERRMKEAMKNDRARVQLGRISAFGLLELSRQRLRPSLIETSFEICSACTGTGIRRTTESTALAILRKLEEEGNKHRASEVAVATPPAVALYLLNQKRRSLLAIEERYGMAVGIVQDAALVPPDHRVERLKPFGLKSPEEAIDAEEPVEIEETVEEGEAPVAVAEGEDGAGRRGRRRRPRRRRRGDEDAAASIVAEPLDEAAAEGGDGDEMDDAAEFPEAATALSEEAGDGSPDDPDGTGEQQIRRRRRRGKRGGRRRARGGVGAPDEFDQPVAAEEMDEFGSGDSVAPESLAFDEDDEHSESVSPDHLDAGPHEFLAAPGDDVADDAPVSDEAPAKPARSRRRPSRRSAQPEATSEGEAVSSEFDDRDADTVDADTDEPDDWSPEEGVSEVGGVLPSLEDDSVEHADELETDRAGGPLDDEWSRDEPREIEDEIVVVGGAYTPLEDDEASPLVEESPTTLEVEPSPGPAPVFDATGFGFDDQGGGSGEFAPEAQPAAPVAYVAELEASPEAAAAEPGTGEPPAPEFVVEGERQGDPTPEDRPFPSEESMMVPDARLGHPEEPRPYEEEARPDEEEDGRLAEERAAELERLAEAARRTEVVRVGEGGQRAEDESRRRGWWQRMLS